MTALNGSAVNTALPVIRLAFHTDVATIQWIVTTYLLVVSALLLTFGRIGDQIGHRRVYLAGFAVFVGCSVLCGIANSPAMMIAARSLQGLGAAMLFASGPAVVTRSCPPEQRGRALGLLGAATYLGLTVGPSVGGWLTQSWTWRAVFYLNVPFGFAAMILAVRFVPPEPRTGSRRAATADGRPGADEAGFDVAGAVLFALALVVLMLAFGRMSRGSSDLGGLAALLGGAFVLLAAFIWRQHRAAAPLLDLSLFRDRLFSAAMISATLNYVAVFCATFVLPFYLIQGRGLAPGAAGALLTAQPLVMAVCTPLSGALSDRIGSRLPSSLGMAILAGGLLLTSRLPDNAPLAWVVAGLALMGLGNGIFASPNSSALMGAAPRHRQGIASGVLATARNLGMMLGVGVAGAIYVSATTGGTGIQASARAAIAAGALIAACGIPISLARGRRSSGE